MKQPGLTRGPTNWVLPRLACAVVSLSMLAACESAEGEMVGQIGGLTPKSEISPTSVVSTTLQPSITTASSDDTVVTPETTPTELPFVSGDAVVDNSVVAEPDPTVPPTSEPPATVAPTTTPTVVEPQMSIGPNPASPSALPRRKVRPTIPAAASPAPANPATANAVPVTRASTNPAPTTKSSFALPTQPTVVPVATVPSDLGVSEIVDVQGVSVPVLDGWVAFTTPESVALNAELADLVQRNLYAQLTQDPTKAVFIPKNELLNALPSMVVVIVRSGTGLTGPAAIERLVGASVDVDGFVIKNQRTILWGSLPSGRSQLAHKDGRSRIVSAVSSEQGRLTVLQTTGNRSDLAAVHDRLLAEINPSQ